jgi:hypothetical protein
MLEEATPARFVLFGAFEDAKNLSIRPPHQGFGCCRRARVDLETV